MESGTKKRKLMESGRRRRRTPRGCNMKGAVSERSEEPAVEFEVQEKETSDQMEDEVTSV